MRVVKHRLGLVGVDTADATPPAVRRRAHRYHNALQRVIAEQEIVLMQQLDDRGLGLSRREICVGRWVAALRRAAQRSL
jgi:hypothetical protein